MKIGKVIKKYEEETKKKKKKEKEKRKTRQLMNMWTWRTEKYGVRYNHICKTKKWWQKLLKSFKMKQRKKWRLKKKGKIRTA